jgi:hypothetical protein
VKRLHTNSKISFPNPYVVRVEYLAADNSFEWSMSDYRKSIKQAYRLIEGTWGYSTLEIESISVRSIEEINQIGLNGMNQAQIFAAIFDPSTVTAYRAYVCFQNELDAMQFRLTISSRAMHVIMWPERKFTIHEVISADES